MYIVCLHYLPSYTSLIIERNFQTKNSWKNFSEIHLAKEVMDESKREREREEAIEKVKKIHLDLSFQNQFFPFTYLEKVLMPNNSTAIFVSTCQIGHMLFVIYIRKLVPWPHWERKIYLKVYSEDVSPETPLSWNSHCFREPRGILAQEACSFSEGEPLTY